MTSQLLTFGVDMGNGGGILVYVVLYYLMCIGIELGQKLSWNVTHAVAHN